MNRALSFIRFVTRTRVLRGCLGLALVAVAWACADKVVGPTLVVPKGQIGVYADLGPAGVTTLVIQASGPGIVKPDNSPDTLAFNIPLVNGIASGSLAIPAGADRVITARAFVGITESHRGTVTTNITEGTNPTLNITMVPLVGTVPIVVTIGSTIVVVRPLLASVPVGDTLRLTSEVRDYNGTIVNGKVRWATLNPNKASVDTNGLVTVKDTGDVQIVGTYGSVGGASRISGVAVASIPSAIHLTWNGSVNTSWTEPNNWTPHGLGAARAPTLTDSVVVPAGAPRYPALPCVDANAVRDVVIEAGAQINPSSCYPLNIYGSAVVAGPIPFVYVRPNAKLSGSFGDIYIKGAGASLAGNVSANFVSVDIPTGTFSLNHHKLTTVSDFNVTGSGGTVTMVDGDTLIIGGNGSWQGGDHNGLLTGGVVIARGNYFYGYRYFGTGTNRVVLDRTATGGTQIGGFDYVNSPANAQIRRLEIKSRDGAVICGHIRVTDTLSIVAMATPSTLGRCSSYQVRVDGPMTTGVNTDVATYLMDLRHSTGTSLISGTWHPDFTEFNTAGETIKPTLDYGSLRFYANNALPANMAITGHLYMQGAGIELDLAGHKLQVASYVEIQDGATVKMANAADSLLIGEYLYYPDDVHGVVKPKLNAGVITVGSYLEGLGFASSGTKVVMTGSSASSSKYINSMNSDSRPTQEVYDLEIAAGANYGLCAKVKVAHDLTIRAGAHLGSWCGSPAIVIQNDLVTEATSSFDPGYAVLNSAIGTSHVLGAYSAGETHFNATNSVIKPGLAYQSVKILAPTQLTGTTALSGWLNINGASSNLTINGQTLTIGAYLQLDGAGTLTMTNAADAVTVGTYANFSNDNSAIHQTKLTAGTLTIGEYLEGTGFSASGTHTVVMSGTGPSSSKYINSLNFESRPSQGFQNLQIGTGATYGLCSRVAVHGTMTVKTGATLQDWCGSPYIRFDGNLVGETGSTIKPYNVMLNSAYGTDNVLGAFLPPHTSIHSTSVAGHLQPGLGYKNFWFYVPFALGANLTVDGDLTVNGPSAVLNLNGNHLIVNGAMNVQSNASLVMQNETDALEIFGNVNWNGGASEAGKLTHGTTTFRGDYFCATNYETGDFHTTVFDRASGVVRVGCVNSSATTQLFSHVEVRGTGVALECNMNVSKDIQVFEGATVRTTCGSGTLYVGEDLITQSGSAVTNGLSYPSSTQLAVSFGNATGTEHVLGIFDPHVSYFTALNSYVKPSDSGIGYRHVRIDQSMQFQDSTEINGNLEVINNAIADLNGNTVVVRGQMDLNNSARMKMVSPNDTLVVAYGDPSADFYWDAGDNLQDASNTLLLTAGAVKFYGDRFIGTQYKATGATNHRFIFMGSGSSVSLEGSPNFANLEIRTTRPIVNNGSLTVVKDTLAMGASTTYGGNNQLQVLGHITTEPGSDLGVATIYVDGVSGTSNVNGGFHPTVALFRSATPSSNAIKPGLQYQSIQISTGQYQLSGTTTLTGNIDILSGGRLTVSGQTLNVAGYLAAGTSGGGFVMNQSTDIVTVGGTFQINSGQVGSALSDGTLTVSGDFNFFDNFSASANHKVVLAGSASKSVNTSANSSRAFQNLDISGTGTVNLQSGIYVNDAFRILSTAAVTNSYSGTTVNGSLQTASGSSLTATNFTFAGSASAINGSFSVPGTLTVNSGGVLSVPSGASLATVNVSGTLNLLGSSTSTQTLTVNSGGYVYTQSLSGSLFADFGRIQVNAGGTLDNNASRSSGAGGFRYKLSGSPSGYTNSGSLTGPAPVGI